jgi:hypothetical protein
MNWYKKAKNRQTFTAIEVLKRMRDTFGITFRSNIGGNGAMLYNPETKQVYTLHYHTRGEDILENTVMEACRELSIKPKHFYNNTPPPPPVEEEPKIKAPGWMRNNWAKDQLEEFLLKHNITIEEAFA